MELEEEAEFYQIHGLIDALRPAKFGVDKTRNMEHPGTFRNIPEHPGTWKNYNIF